MDKTGATVQWVQESSQLRLTGVNIVRETGVSDIMSGQSPLSIAETLKQRGVRLTRQRRIILDLIDRTGEHLDAEQIFQLARRQDPKINRVTVYRTLKLLKDWGLIDELDLMHFNGEQHYYETRLKQEHAHIVCLRCGKVEEFFGEPLQKLRRQIEEHFGFQILVARTEVGGYCAHCQILNAQEAAENQHPRKLLIQSGKPSGRQRKKSEFS